MEPQALILADALTDLIRSGMATSPRSQQTEVGASEIGFACPRRLCYRARGYPKFNVGDQMRLLTGIGMHDALAEIFRRHNQSQRVARFLVEYPIFFSDVRGTIDLFDKATNTIVDWKTTSKARLTKYAHDGPPGHYITQIHTYAAGLAEEGYLVKRVALAFLPFDGPLSATWVWLGEPNRRAAIDAVDRLRAVASAEPAEVPTVPDRYCGFCDFYVANSIDPRLGCPGT